MTGRRMSYCGGFIGGAMICAWVLALSGCGGNQIMEVNKAAIANRASYTDPNSAAIARKTMAMAADRITDYRVGPEDLLEISIFEWELRGETRALDVRVEESGIIALPVLGDVTVGGLTVQQIKALLEKRLVDGGILKDPRVSVVIKEYRSKRVSVVGAVQEPGVYTLRKNVTTLFSVLTLAGGPTERAGHVLYVVRNPNSTPTVSEISGENDEQKTLEVTLGKQPEVIAVDTYELLELGRLDINVILQDGDIVNVPEAMKFYVIGFVEKPGGFPLTRPTTLLEGIALAGGLRERRASPRKCALKRYTAEGEIVQPLDLVAISRGQASNIYLQPEDIIDVRQTRLRAIGLEIYDFIRAIFSVGYSISN